MRRLSLTDEYSGDEDSTQELHPRHSVQRDGRPIVDELALADAHDAPLSLKKRLWWRNAVVNMAFIATWFLFATVLSVYNKWMFSVDHFAFPYPLFVTTMHMYVQFALAAAMRNIWPRHFKPKNRPSRRDYCVKALPTAVTSSLDIGLSNFSLKTITLSFYTMCKSSSLIFVLMFAFLFRLERFSWRVVGVIFLIFAGVLLMVATETKFILEGFLLVISASAFGGLRWSLTQLLLRDPKIGLDNPAATIYWLAPAMGATLAVISAIVESWMKLFRSEFFATGTKSLQTIFFLTAPGIIAFGMVLSEFYIIKRTGVIPMSIAGIAKEVTTITISAWFFGDQLTPLNITGVAVTICGIMLFTFHKYRKSIESKVPLDAHGNPIFVDDANSDTFDGGRSQYVELDETVRLTSGSSHASDDLEDDDREGRGPETEFGAGDGGEDGELIPRRSLNHSLMS